METGYSIELPYQPSGLNADLYRLHKALYKSKYGDQSRAREALVRYVASLSPEAAEKLEILLATFGMAEHITECRSWKREGYYLIEYLSSGMYERGGRHLGMEECLTAHLEFLDACGVKGVRGVAQFDESPEQLVGYVEGGRVQLKVRNPDAPPPTKVSKASKLVNELVDACAEGDLEKIRALTAQGVNPLDRTNDGFAWTALSSAAHHNRLEVLSYFFEQGVSLNEPDGQGYRPIHWTAFTGAYAALVFLLDAGCSPNSLSTQGGANSLPQQTVLSIAIDYTESPAFVKTLLERGADPNLPSTKYKISPLRSAINSKPPSAWSPEAREIIRLLKEFGAKD